MNKLAHALALSMAIGGSVQAAVIEVGTWDVPAGNSAFSIPVQIVGDANETVTDMSLRVQIADGGPQPPLGGTIPGPAIVGVDFADTIWSQTDVDARPSPGLGVGHFRQLVQYDVNIAFNTGQPVPANGVLVRLTVDVTGFEVGESFPILLRGTRAGNTTFLGLNGADVRNGEINIVIPEPTTFALFVLVALLGCTTRID